MIDISKKNMIFFNFYNKSFEKVFKDLKKEERLEFVENLAAEISACLNNSITRVEKAEKAEKAEEKEIHSNEFKEYIRKIQKFGDEEFFIKTFGETLDRRYGNSKEEGSSMSFNDWIENFLNENS